MAMIDVSDKLANLAKKLSSSQATGKIIWRTVDIGNYLAVDKAVASVVQELVDIDILINNASVALGAPARFHELHIPDIMTMVNTNINGFMYVTYSVLNRSMLVRRPSNGTILNVTSITSLEVPRFQAKAVYHANKAFQEALTNALRNELSGTNIRILALRPGCVATNFHSLRVGHDREKYDQFFEGFEPLVSDDIAQATVYMLNQPLNVSVKAMDVVPSAQRSITVFDRKWNERNS
ncbi:NAD(P)-binding protein [Aspergillus cavernicola]|uniref:NAD(P)-binding protein n=1 Tax=Aspergillus cavernicola TaxID=176166 RepID=A0ABR4HNR7_9EURO